MSCDACHGVRKVFGERLARRDLRRYRRRGPSRTTSILLDALLARGVEGLTIIDIGTGVGAIPNELLTRGARRAMLVEASPAYLRVAREEAERRGHGQRTEFREGDLVEIAPGLSPADIVTLDRVVCCYHDADALLSASLGLAQRFCALVWPREAWWTRAGVAAVNLLMRLSGNGYRAFVHRDAVVERAFAAAGMKLSFHRTLGPWQVALYLRDPVPEADPG